VAAADMGTVDQDLTVSSASIPNLQQITARDLCIHKAIAELRFRRIAVDDNAGAAVVKGLLKQCELELAGCGGHFQWTMPAEVLEKHDEREVVRKLKGRPAVVAAATSRNIDDSGNVEQIRTRIMRSIMGTHH